MISTQMHGIMDYIMGLVLIASPFLFGFATGGAAMWVPIILGIGVICYSLITAYEYGATPMITMKTHLLLDVSGGLLLALSPWLFGFASVVYLPHLILGIAEILAAAMTERAPARSTRRAAQNI